MTPCRPPGATEITAGGVLLFSLASFLLDDATVFTTSVRSVLRASQQKPVDLVQIRTVLLKRQHFFARIRGRQESRKAGKQESDLV
jgi:hypothetical protein